MQLSIKKLQKNIELDKQKHVIREIHEKQLKGRYIPRTTLEQLKKITKCEHKNCKETTKLEIHHIIPISKGGTNHRNNLKKLCHKHHKEEDQDAGIERYQA